MPAKPARALLSWSSGKDAAWTLQCLRESEDFEVVGLVTTVNRAADRVAMHGVRRDILERQAQSAGLDLFVVKLPSPCSNAEYELRIAHRLAELRQRLDVTHIVFGDLFLQDVRNYREKQMREIGLEPVFPLWGQATRKLAQDMLDGGLEAYVTCVDKTQLPEGFSGRRYDQRLLSDLPEEVDHCGENGEFHTMVVDGPMFEHRIEVNRGPLKADPRFVFTDFQSVHTDITADVA